MNTAASACLAQGAHVVLPGGLTCGIWERLTCDPCGVEYVGDPHSTHACPPVETLQGPAWHAVDTEHDGMCDLYCSDPECLGDYVTRDHAWSVVPTATGLCDGCREAIAIAEATYRTFDPEQS